MAISYKTSKDVERADNLNWRGNTFHPMGGDIAISNASRMAKVITHQEKLLGRFEAVCERWGDWRIQEPFVNRILELFPNSEFSGAYHSGLHSGQYSMSPGGPGGYKTVAANLMYNYAWNKGRGYNR